MPRGKLNNPINSKCENCGKKIILKGIGQKYCSDCSSRHRRIWQKNNKNRVAEYQRKFRKKQRILALKYYGGNPPICACCGEKNVEFLCIDHINGGGLEHRRKIWNKYRYIYDWLVKKNYPKGFRVLCHNCNMSIGFYGYCPHDKTKQIQINFVA